jgi:hypothetical protein
MLQKYNLSFLSGNPVFAFQTVKFSGAELENAIYIKIYFP